MPHTISLHIPAGAIFALLLPITMAAADAVTVNADGTTKFSYAVAGPNLLGTAAPVPISDTTTLDATAAGKIYSIQGTSKNYTITLPPAGIGAGTVIAFSVLPWNSANQQYTIAPVSGQTLDGRSNGLALVYTNYLELVSIGGNWISRVKNLNTDWINAGKLLFWGTGANPGKPADSSKILNDSIAWQRIENSMHIKIAYRHTAAGSQGSGSYYFKIPNGFVAATSTYTYSANSTGTFPYELVPLALPGNAIVCNTDALMVGFASLYDPSSFRVCGVATNGSSTNRWIWGSNAAAMNASNIQFSCDVTIPIQNW